MGSLSVNSLPANMLSQEFYFHSLLKFVWPAMFMMLFMGLYTIIDLVFVANYIHIEAVSALNIVCPVINIIVGLGTMLASGGSAVVARKMGNGDGKRARQDFTLIITAGGGLGILAAAVGILLLDDLIWLLGASEVLFPYCKAYLFVLLLFTPASIMQILFQSLIVTAGYPGFGMVLSIVAGMSNIIFDYVFIVFYGMGMTGAALGTGLGYLIPTAAAMVFFMRSKGVLWFQQPVPDLKVLTESCLNGFSEMVGQAASAVTTFLFNITMMRLLGEDGVAAITILIYTQFLLTTLYIGFSMGVAPIISYAVGSGNHGQLKRVFRLCLLLIAGLSVGITLSSFLGGPFLVAVFASENTKIYEITNVGFRIVPIGFLFCGLNIFASAMFTALANGKISAVISFCRTFVFIGLGLLFLPRVFHVFGVWLAVPFAEFLTFLAAGFFIMQYRKVYHYG